MGATRVDVAVVGAGITGLAAAFHLARGGLAVTVLEAEPRAGGAIETWRDGEWRFELGPNTVSDGEPALQELIVACGLQDHRLAARPEASRRYLWRGGGLHPLPASPLDLLETPLLSARAKLRLLREPWAPAATAGGEESVAAFVERRLGPEAVEAVAAPLVAGVYAGDPARLSMSWAFPKIAALERRHGSLLRGARAARTAPKTAGGIFTLRDGLEELPRRLAATLAVRADTPCLAVRRAAEAFRLETPAGEIEAAHVVLTPPAWTTGDLLRGATGGRSAELGEIPYAPVAVVALGLRREQVRHPLDGFGFLAAPGSGLRLMGCVFASSLFVERAPAGHVALTALAGGRLDPELVSWRAEEIGAAVLADLRSVLGIEGEPQRLHVRRWRRAIPQYELGHGRFVELARRLEAELPGLHVAGSFLDGVAVPDCAARGAGVAREILAMLL